MKFIKRYRQWPEGYELKEGEVSDAQLALLNKRGVIEQSGSSKSTDYTVAELREMKPGVDDWDSFIEGDERKSVHSL